jgi:thiamine biosynthesis lipoprotein
MHLLTHASTTGLTIGRFETLGTEIVVAVTDAEQLGALVEHAHTCIDEIDRTFSRFRSDSELERLHRSGPGWQRATSLFVELLELALHAARSTSGLFDPTVRDALEAGGYDRSIELIERDGPGPAREAAAAGRWKDVAVDRVRGLVSLPDGVRLDFGGIGKGFAVDYTLRRLLVVDCGVMISAGGDLAVTGPAPNDGWPCGISLTSADPVEETVLLRQGALASSGLGRRQWVRGGQRLHHLIDPTTSAPANSPWALVTVAAGTCVAADVAAKVAWLKGMEGPSWIDSIGLAGRFREADGKLTMTSRWPQRIEGQ